MDGKLKEKIILRDLVLTYFNEAEGRGVHEMKAAPCFKPYKEREVSDMRLALAECGLIALISGYGNGSSYQTTDDGIIFLEALTNYDL